MSTNDVLGFAGGIKSGKSTLAEAVACDQGCACVSFGSYVRSIAREQDKGESREVLQQIGECLIDGGIPAFCNVVLGQAEWHRGQALVIDGIRHVDIVTELRRVVQPYVFRLVYVSLDPAVRESRLRKTEVTSLEVLEQHSTEIDVRAALPRIADLTLDGERRVDDLVADVRAWLVACRGARLS